MKRWRTARRMLRHWVRERYEDIFSGRERAVCGRYHVRLQPAADAVGNPSFGASVLYTTYSRGCDLEITLGPLTAILIMLRRMPA